MMLSITSLKLIYLYLSTPITHFAHLHSLPLAMTNPFSVSMGLIFFFFFFFKIPHIGVPDVAQWLMNLTRNHAVAGSIPGLD